MARYRVLSLDGGGIRGLVTVILLQRLNTHRAIAGWLEHVDLIAGTSTGGIIALALARGIDLETLQRLYAEKGKDIFDDSILDDVFDLGRIAGAEYDNKNLARELASLFGETPLSALRKRVLITSFDLDSGDNPVLPGHKPRREQSWKPKLFHNYPGKDSDGMQLAREVALYTSAAPTYFPSVNGYIDGGVYAINPAMCALAQTQDRRWSQRPSLDDVVLFSVGTGTAQVSIPGRTHDWGYARWAKPLVSLMLDGVTGIADYQCDQILGEERYHRLAPWFPRDTHVPMDAVDKVPYLVDFAWKRVNLDETIKWIARNWMD
jgi:predicted acylesterase/phospholipase RssA